MYLKYIKLSSGDNIIATTDDDCSTFKRKEFITITNPVRIGVISLPGKGMHIETHVFLPWITIAATTTMKLPTKSIIMTVDVDESVNTHYQDFISNNNTTILSEGGFSSIENYYDEMDDEDEDDNDPGEEQPNYH